MRAILFAVVFLSACKGSSDAPPSASPSQAPVANAGSAAPVGTIDAALAVASSDAAAAANAVADAGAVAASADAAAADDPAKKRAADIDAIAARLAHGPVAMLHTGSGGDPPAGLSADAINAVIKESSRAIRECYSRELAKSPNLAGKVVVAFEIGKTGNVVSAKPGRGGTLTNAKVTSCITGVVKTLKFPPPEGVDKVSVTYPFIFVAQQ